MLIDIIFVVLLGLAVFKGGSKGLIVAVFSLLGFIVGMAAALKLSSVVANKISASTGSTGPWLPFLSFLIVFVAAMFLVRLGAKLIQKTVEFAMLGWINRIGGIIFYALLYAMIMSVLLFYLVQMKIISTTTTNASYFYPYLKPLAPYVLETIGKVIPIFKDLFAQLQSFFGSVAAQPSQNSK